MKPRLRRIIDLLLSHPDATVAEMTGVTLVTLREWMKDPKFAEALRAREREQAESARRLARQAVLNSAAAICQLAADATKCDPKLLLDILKASGSLQAEAEDPGAALAEVIRSIQEEED